MGEWVRKEQEENGLNPPSQWAFDSVYEDKTISWKCFNIRFLEKNVFSRVNSITVISFHDCFPMKKFKEVPFSYCHFYFTETPFIRINTFVLDN